MYPGPDIAELRTPVPRDQYAEFEGEVITIDLRWNCVDFICEVKTNRFDTDERLMYDFPEINDRSDMDYEFIFILLSSADEETMVLINPI